MKQVHRFRLHETYETVRVLVNVSLDYSTNDNLPEGEEAVVW